MSYLYSLYDALVSINVPSDKVRAVVDAMERDMLTELASKSDLDNLRVAIKADIDNLRLSMQSDSRTLSNSVDAFQWDFRLQCDLLLASMTIRFGLMLIVGLSLLFAALKLTGP